GDLLFQVVFHAQIAREAGHFDFDAVAESIARKLERRHPHVFAGQAPGGAAEQARLWERLKAEERRESAGGAPGSLLDDVPRALPALMRTHKLGRRAAHAGFDFPTALSAADKVAEELAETIEAAGEAGPGAPRVVEEVGDLLFAAANLARKLEVDPELALRAANAKFERRVRGMERLAAEQGLDFAALDPQALEDLWQRMKSAE
ncbi:MAG: nucleoside triphosphate pyrophosphohydrolase, partial [Gammaproteobacteria bacterium]|nr:nucleoside triphosphate pyrophosphohydrolase [Gammaproteobacteria bacterium]